MLRLPASDERSSARCAVDLGVNRRGQSTSVTQELADLWQRRPSPQHLYRGRVPQPMRMDSPEASPLGSICHHIAHAAGTEMAMRGFDSDKYSPPLGADRTATLEIP